MRISNDSYLKIFLHSYVLYWKIGFVKSILLCFVLKNEEWGFRNTLFWKFCFLMYYFWKYRFLKSILLFCIEKWGVLKILPWKFLHYNALYWNIRFLKSSSCECKKVVSSILGETKFVVDIESTCKMTHFESWYKSQLKVFTFLWTKQYVKKQWNTKKIWAQNCFFHKMTKMHLRPSYDQKTMKCKENLSTVICKRCLICSQTITVIWVP